MRAFGTILLVAVLMPLAAVGEEVGVNQASTADEAFLRSLTVAEEVVVPATDANPLGWSERSIEDCARLASACLRANCECSETCGGVVAAYPCFGFPRQWGPCICG